MNYIYFIKNQFVEYARFVIVLLFLYGSVNAAAADKPQIQYAKEQIAQKSYKAAISTLNNYLEDYPKDVDALYWRGYAYYKDKQYEIAEIKLNEVLKLNPSYVPALETLAIMSYDKKDYQTAVQYFNSVIHGNDTSKDYYNMRGMCYFYIDNYDQAIKDFNKAIKLDSNFYLAINNRGACRYSNQNIAEASMIDLALAEKDFNKALAIKPDFQLAYRNRGIVKMMMDSLDVAYKDLLKATQMDEKDDKASFYLAKVLFKQKNYPVAIQFYDNAIKIVNYKPEYYIERGICKMTMLDFKAARKDFYQTMMISDEAKGRAYYEVARTYAAEENDAKMFESLEEAAKFKFFVKNYKYFGYMNNDEYFAKYKKDKDFYQLIQRLKFGKY
ncbi:MAG: tetratricopeptide repeat protein [Chitinophagales bacterium]